MDMNPVRFDLSNFIRQQNSMRSSVFDPQSSEEYRRMASQNKNRRSSKKRQFKSKSIARSRKKLLEQIRNDRQEKLNRILNQALLQLHQIRRRSEDDFAYHDLMDSDEGNIDDFSANLEIFKGNIKENKHGIISRRNLPAEDESILMNYAFPINLKIEGFLQTPVK